MASETAAMALDRVSALLYIVMARVVSSLNLRDTEAVTHVRCGVNLDMRCYHGLDFFRNALAAVGVDVRCVVAQHGYPSHVAGNATLDC
jgi:hypothetical protein